MTKEYFISDLFFTSWQELRSRPHRHAEVVIIKSQLDQLKNDPSTIEYGLALIGILKRLIKNQRLVDKINEAQAVDIFNNLTFLQQPWYFFPAIGDMQPTEKLATATFDEWIYADHEFTKLLADEKGMQDERDGLARLAATLYMGCFDKERVEKEARAFHRINILTLQLVFFTFGHVREFVIKRCKHLLPTSPSVQGEAETKMTGSGPLWHNIKHQAARTLVFGDFVTLGKSNMYDVLDHLELLAKEKPHANP